VTSQSKPPTPTPPIPTIASIKFREPVTFDNITPMTAVDPSKGYDIAVSGGSVFITLNQRRIVVEVPRAHCIIQWAIPEGLANEDAVRALTKGGLHSVKAKVKERAKPEMLRPARDDDDEDDLAVGA